VSPVFLDVSIGYTVRALNLDTTATRWNTSSDPAWNVGAGVDVLTVSKNVDLGWGQWRRTSRIWSIFIRGYWKEPLKPLKKRVTLCHPSSRVYSWQIPLMHLIHRLYLTLQETRALWDSRCILVSIFTGRRILCRHSQTHNFFDRSRMFAKKFYLRSRNAPVVCANIPKVEIVYNLNIVKRKRSIAAGAKSWWPRWKFRMGVKGPECERTARRLNYLVRDPMSFVGFPWRTTANLVRGRVFTMLDRSVDTHSSLYEFRTHFWVWFVPVRTPLPHAHQMVFNDI